MSLLQIKEAIKNRMDSDKLLQIPKGHAILATTHFYLACKKLGIYTPEDTQDIQTALTALRIKPGLFMRWQGAYDIDEQHDNYVALCTVGKLSGLKVAKEINDYGKTNQCWLFPFNYMYCNSKQSIFSKRFWVCKRQGFSIYLYQALAGSWWVNPLYWLWYVLSVLFASFKPPVETSSKLLVILQLYALDKWHLKPIHSFFKWRMKRQYGEMWMYEIYDIYYGVSFPELIELIERI